MKRIIAGLMMLLMGVLLTQTAGAKPPYPGLKHQQQRERHRINQGIRSGELTRKEAAHLKMQQAKIRHDKRCARADGIVTPGERAYIKGEQDMASRNIYFKKHNARSRF